MTPPKPVVLCILDGWGLRASTSDNAVAQARTPHYDRIMKTCPHATLKTSGHDVGLPAGQMGNSEVGHMNIGAGRIVKMDLGRIGAAIGDGSFERNDALLKFCKVLKDSGGSAHLIGLVSDGGVHAHIDHMIAAVNIISAAGVPVKIHTLSDGRDVAPGTIGGFLDRLDASLPANANIATLTGRYFAMDRDKRWTRVKRAFDTIVAGTGFQVANYHDAISAAKARGESDEFFQPTTLGDYKGVAEGDGVFCLNFRADRARELLAAMGDPEFNDFAVPDRPDLAAMLGMITYSGRHAKYMTHMFARETIVNTLGEWVSKHGKTQFRLAETEKYPHVTFFFNGGIEPPSKGEQRFMPQSPDVATYDLQPEMSSTEVTDSFITAIEHRYDLIIVNYANPDMVGHTGDMAAAVKAVEAVDQGLGRALNAVASAGGAMIVTADHGNCETMVDPETGNPHTAHTTNPVPVVVVGAGPGTKLRDDGRLADLAPTLLELMAMLPPPEMSGKSLII